MIKIVKTIEHNKVLDSILAFWKKGYRFYRLWSFVSDSNNGRISDSIVFLFKKKIYN